MVQYLHAFSNCLFISDECYQTFHKASGLHILYDTATADGECENIVCLTNTVQVALIQLLVRG